MDVFHNLKRAIEECGSGKTDEMEHTICTMSEDELDSAVLIAGEVYEALLQRQRELEREMNINAR